jgi:aquaglyceroporin related protein
MVPLVIFFLILGIGAAFGMQTGQSRSLLVGWWDSYLGFSGYAINPARDLGPRLMTWTVGYGREGEREQSRE